MMRKGTSEKDALYAKQLRHQVNVRERTKQGRKQLMRILTEDALGGYTWFIFLNRDDLPKVMTPYTLRHMFCTNLANAGMNPTALQYIMSHSNINMTLNYYAHATSDSAVAEMERLTA